MAQSHGVSVLAGIAIIVVASNLVFSPVAPNVAVETSPRVGDLVLAIGNPFGLVGTVTAGIVSARARDIGDGRYEDLSRSTRL